MRPALSLTIYNSKQQAEEGRKTAGGIVLEVNAASLNIPDQSESGEHVALMPDDENEGGSPSHAFISVCYAGLPHKMVPNYGTYEPGTVEPQGDCADFGAEAGKWLSELERETGSLLHQ